MNKLIKEFWNAKVTISLPFYIFLNLEMIVLGIVCALLLERVL
jgi:hypothetical protein